MSEQAYWLHHLCIYDERPRDHMWTWLKWYHAIPQYYWGGEEFHLTDEGHVDYTFLACGSGFQIQMESPPFQFKYEQAWHAEHGSGINHICWVVPDAKATVDYLMSNGCTTRMEYEEFGVYRGYVCADPEGRWIEIMDYIGDFKTPDVEFRPIGIPGLQLFGVTQLTENLGALEIRLSDEQLATLDDVSQVDLGFPHNFLSDPNIRDVASGGSWERIDNHRRGR